MSFDRFFYTSNFTIPNFGLNFVNYTMPNFEWNNNVSINTNLSLSNSFNNNFTYPVGDTFISSNSNTYQFNISNSFNNTFFNSTFSSNAGMLGNYINNSWQNLKFPTISAEKFSFNITNWGKSLVSGAKVEQAAQSYNYDSSKDINTTTNARYLKNLTREMQERTKKLIAYANANGYDVQISSGYRTPTEQLALQEKYKNEPGRVAKKSAHSEGKAIDIKVTKNGKETDVGYSLLGEYAKSQLDMRWGGDFTTYRERWHFDYDWA